MTAVPAGFQTGFPVRPDLVVEAADAEEVRAAVARAAREGHRIALHATGHGLPGPVDGGVLISTRRLDEVRVDPERRTAWIGAGVTWGQVIEAAAPHGLAPLNGSSPGVGAVSYTLGGGLGVLAREFGYAADRVRALDLVTADGSARRVTADGEPELFWGLRGGGHRLGAVTGLEVGLVPVARLYGGVLAFDGDGDGAAGVVRHWLEWTRTVPDTVTSSVAAMVYPPIPQVPEELRGRYVLSVRVAFTGAAKEGERLVAPLRAAGPALRDSLREMPYTDSHTIHNDPPFPHAYYGDGLMLSGLDAGRAARVLELTGRAAPVMTVVQLNHLGGALAAAPDPDSAVPYREAAYLLRLLTPLDGTDVASARALHAEVADALGPLVVGRSLNFSFGGGDRTDRLHGPRTAKRLAGLVSRYDPASLFGGPYGVSPGGR
ncbi:FAD-binding protein [Streptomyces sp. NBC_01789]|uniref:FAD-binding oxidoreductase n=1 Tax=unclassified Streptomyces TaxID=2593676 RepID=UPI00224D21C9|nr:FAD-binding protein [Streptomyces sp. NBC_01789]MCX4449137.1 FAD-binding protein [Streptomyces sp. NBC_01789]